MHTNHLAREKSPYLLQHTHNPVDWYPWSEEAFAKARQENKPIFLSIGYSTCHWCHVMAHESFESEEIAEILNAHFVCVKVDREERPDVDQVYMTFVQATTGGGGWPMSVWLTPELTPFFGGTYFPPQQLTTLAGNIAEAWEADSAGIITHSTQVIETLRQAERQSRAATVDLGSAVWKKAFRQIADSFDATLGGFGAAPKFPRPVIFNFLGHVYANDPESKDGKQALEMTLITLRRMAAGGIHDHLGGGFHRYSVDRFWHVPHFEKMLYDQAQLATAYLMAFQLTREPLLERVARDILDYVARDLTDSGGGFYSAEDADSQVASNTTEHAEGAFYVWTVDEIQALLGKERASLFNYCYGVEADGNAPADSDPRGEFKGHNILIQRHTLAETATKFGLTEDQTAAALTASRDLLFKAREKRPRPHLDDKIITSWNGLMISALARAAQVLNDTNYRDAAIRAASFVRENLYREEDQTLLRSYREGASAVEGFADDYAFLIQGLLDLYETAFEVQWIEWATVLQKRQDELFWDDENAGYFSTTGQDSTILLRAKESYDGAEPAPSAVAALNLIRLAHMLGRADWRERAEKTLHAFGPHLESAPSAMPQMLVAWDGLRAPPRQIVIAGKPDAPDTRALLQEVNRRFIPNKVVLLADGDAGQTFFAGQTEFMKGVTPLDGRATAYVCENFVCQLPTTDPSVLTQMLSGQANAVQSGQMADPPRSPNSVRTSDPARARRR